MELNLFLVGAQKAGTSALAATLGCHRDIACSTPKEPHYFSYGLDKVEFNGPGDGYYIDKSLRSTLDQYRRVFLSAGRASVFLDASTSYLYNAQAARRIREYDSRSKIIIALRDPVKRAISSHRHLLRAGRENEVNLWEAIQREPERIKENYEYLWRYVSCGMYCGQIERYFGEFPRDRVYIVVYENLISNPEKYLREIYSFIGVEPDAGPSKLLRVNQSLSPPKFPELDRFIRSDWYGKTLIKRVVDPRIYSPINNYALRLLSGFGHRDDGGKQGKDVDVQAVRALFEDDIERLSELLSFDFRKVWAMPNA